MADEDRTTPRWLEDLLPTRVHPASAAHADHDPLRAPAPGRGPDPREGAAHFPRRRALREARQRERERRRAGWPPRDLARVYRGLGERPTTNDEYDRQTLEVLRRVLGRGSHCVDVGCHRGEILDAILAHAPDGEHLAVEPIPELAAHLEERYRDHPGVHVHALALGERAGRARFHHVVSNPGYSGLRRRTYDRPDEEVHTIEVEVARLDDLLPREREIALIKIDVEGAELSVLRGARRTLVAHHPVIVFEHGLGASDHYGVGPAQISAFLEGECGYAINTMARYLEGEPPLDLAAFETRYLSGLDYYFMGVPRPSR